MISRNPIRINHYLRQRGITQAELARRVRCNPATISRLASGKQFLSERMEQLIAHELELTDDERNHMLGFSLGAGQADGTYGATVAGRSHLRLVESPEGSEREAAS